MLTIQEKAIALTLAGWKMSPVFAKYSRWMSPTYEIARNGGYLFHLSEACEKLGIS